MQKFSDFLAQFWEQGLNNANGKFGYTRKGAESQIYEGNFSIADKPQQLPPDSGILFNENEARAVLNGSTLEVRLPQSVGLIQNSVQQFKKISWSVQGPSGNVNISAGGDSLDSRGDTLIQERTENGRMYYYFAIPEGMGYGEYNITLQFWENENDPTYFKAISVRL